MVVGSSFIVLKIGLFLYSLPSSLNISLVKKDKAVLCLFRTQLVYRIEHALERCFIVFSPVVNRQWSLAML